MKKLELSKSQKILTMRIVSALVLEILFFIIPSTGTLRILLFCIPYLLAGYDIIFRALKNIFTGKIFDEEFLMTVATVGAFAVGEYPEAAGVMIFFQIGELFQDIAVDNSKKSISALMDIKPESAVVIRDGKELTVSPEEVRVSETIMVKPGEKIPLDGVVVKGSSSLDCSALTGESIPSDKTEGDNVVSGTVNMSSVLYIRTTGLYSDSTVAKILDMVENSSEKKAKSENFITRFAHYYTPIIVISAILLAVIPPLVLNQSFMPWINRALIFLMVSCPCALVVSVPLSFFSGIGAASRSGILIKGANYLESLSKADTVVFDKTGTLTKGVFSVNAIHPNEISDSELLDIAAAAESYSNHPVASSIVAAHKGHIDKSRISDVCDISGKGISAVVSGKTYYVGNGKLMDSVNAAWHPCHLSGTVIHISQDSNYLGHIIVSDEIKPDSKDALHELLKLGIKKNVMLTGDSESVASVVAKKIGVDEYHSQLLPDQKVEKLEELISEGCHVAFVGDGINDAPVLARADVGIAMGAMGSDAAIESADIVLMDDKPSKIPEAVRISRKTMSIVKQNIIVSLSIKAIILILTPFGFINMWIAVFGDVGVLILATLNSLRTLIKYKKRKS